MERKYKILLITAVLILYLGLLVVGAIIKVPSDLKFINKNDKIIHFMEFFFLSLILLKALDVYNLKSMNKYDLEIAIAIGMMFMLLSESVQLFTETRTFSYNDLISDVVGFTIGVLVFIFVRVFKWKFSKP